MPEENKVENRQEAPPVPTPPPVPAPEPHFSTFQLLAMLWHNFWGGITGIGTWAGGKSNSLWDRTKKAFHDSLLVAILLAAVAGFVGGKASQLHVPSLEEGWNNFWSFIFSWVHPGPTPPPGPGPGPHPGPAPIPAKGLHVLVVGDESKMTSAQINALKSTEVRTYLNSVCPKGPDGKTAEYRIWPSSVDTTNESQLWKDAFKRTNGKALPWIVVSNPDKGGGFEGPLPADQKALLDLLKKFGG